jgi:hypothetical protein
MYLPEDQSCYPVETGNQTVPGQWEEYKFIRPDAVNTCCSAG